MAAVREALVAENRLLEAEIKRIRDLLDMSIAPPSEAFLTVLDSPSSSSANPSYSLSTAANGERQSAAVARDADKYNSSRTFQKSTRDSKGGELSSFVPS